MRDAPPAGFDTWRAFLIHTLEQGREQDELDRAAARDVLVLVVAAVLLLAAYAAGSAA